MLHYTDSFPGKEIYINGIPHLYFGGTSYLGLQTDVDFQNTFIKNIRIYGTNYGASRKSNIQLSIFEETEAYLSQTVGSEACLTISSGYLAGQLVVQFLNDKAHKFFYTPNTHTALFEGKRKVYYQNYGKLKKALDIHLKSNEKSVPVILLDSIDFTANNYPSFTGLKTLPLEKVILVVDDSHGIGIVGENGGGIYKEIKALGAKELIVCCSLGKGFGVQGGAIFGNKKRIDEFSATQFFGGASPASPAGLATLLNSETIYQKKRGVLKENIYDLTTNLENFERFVHMAEHPTFSFSDAPLVQKLEKNHILVTNFNYPDENSALMSRIVLSASHKKEDIQKLCSHLNAP